MLRSSLYIEQKGLCAYCMQKIKNDKTSKIEHFYPRNKNNELDYNNLLLVCMGGSDRKDNFKNLTCDSHKENFIITINPLSKKDINTIYYKNNGEICSKDEKMNNEIDNILNLNHQNLLENRKAVLDILKKEIRNEILNKSNKNYRQLINKKLNQIKKQKIYPSYVGIMIWYLDKKIK